MQSQSRPYSPRADQRDALETRACLGAVENSRTPVAPVEVTAQNLVDTLDLLVALQAPQTLTHACELVATKVSQRTSCQTAAIGCVSNASSPVRLVALSNTSKFDPKSRLVEKIESAMQEAILLNHNVECSVVSEQGCVAHQQLRNHLETPQLCSYLIRNADGQAIGVLLQFGTAALSGEKSPNGAAKLVAAKVGPILQTFLDRDQPAAVRIVRRIRHSLNSRRKLVIAALLLAVCGALATPMPYKVHCNCRIEPFQKRFVVAPFASRLERTYRKAGELVQAGDTLATLDGSDMRLELSDVAAEIDTTRKTFEAALARELTVDAQQAQLELDRLSLKREFLESRQRQLSIACPVEGTVVENHFEHSEGAPLSMGELMFEIAPLNTMLVDVAIPEQEASYVAVDMPVQLYLETYPGRSWNGKLSKIHPRAELRDESSVFVAEFLLENDDKSLRPGMNGKAVVSTERRPLAWNLFHGVWESTLRIIGW